MAYKQFLEKLLKVLKVLIILAPFVLFAWLLNRHFVPGGEFRLVQDFHKESSISLLKPDYAVSKIKKENNIYNQKILGDKVYFETKVPRRFREAEVTIEYQNPDQNLLEMRVLMDKKLKEYQTETLEYQTIDNSDWHRIEKDNLVFLQKEKNFNSIDEFLENVPDDKIIAQHNYDVKKELLIADYKPQDKLLDLDKTLRGSLTMYTYIKDELLDFTFYKQDLNWYEGEDKVDISVWKNSQKVFEDTIEDDGITTPRTEEEFELGPLQEKQIQVSDLAEGVYKIEFTCSDDVLIRKIQTKQHLLVFSGKHLYLADCDSWYHVPDHSQELYTNTSELVVATPHETALQWFKINDRYAHLAELHRPQRFSEELYLDRLNYISFPVSDIRLQSKEGVFAFSEETFFNPIPRNLIRLRLNTNLDEVDYVIAQYSSPQECQGWKRKTVNFEVQKAELEKAKDGNFYTFTFSAPKIEEPKKIKENEEEKEIAKEIKIRKIEILFKKDPITFKNFFDRLKGYIQRKF